VIILSHFLNKDRGSYKSQKIAKTKWSGNDKTTLAQSPQLANTRLTASLRMRSLMFDPSLPDVFSRLCLLQDLTENITVKGWETS
jgi:hypothetical protein